MLNAALENLFIFCIGTSLLAMGLVLLYRHHWMLKLNDIIRNWLFNDAIILLERRKKAAFLMLAACVFYAWGYHRIHYSGLRIMDQLVSNDRLLYQSLNHIYDKQFQQAEALCRKVLRRDPKNADAMYQLAVTQLLKQDIQNGKTCWQTAQRLNSNPEKAERFRMLLAKFQSQDHPVTQDLDSIQTK